MSQLIKKHLWKDFFDFENKNRYIFIYQKLHKE